jgi:hypothetical protein
METPCSGKNSKFSNSKSLLSDKKPPEASNGKKKEQTVIDEEFV